MTLLQAAATETLSKYDDSKIVVGIIICFALMTGFMFIYDKYLKKQPKVELSGLQVAEMINTVEEKLKPRKVELTGVQAIEVTQQMGQKIMDELIIGGSSAGKRAEKLHHKVNEALANNTDMSTLVVEFTDKVDELVAAVGVMNGNMVAHYKETNKKTDELNKTLLNLLVKNKR